MAFLAGLRTNEEQRLGDQIKEADEKRKAMEEAKAAKLHEGFLAAKAFNAAQTAANDEAKVRLFQEDRRNAEELKMKFKESMAEEAAKEEASRTRVKKLQQFHVKQIEEKKHKMSLLQDETNEEIRDMERQFAVQVRLLLFAASRAIAFVCWCVWNQGLYKMRIALRCCMWPALFHVFDVPRRTPSSRSTRLNSWSACERRARTRCPSSCSCRRTCGSRLPDEPEWSVW